MSNADFEVQRKIYYVTYTNAPLWYQTLLSCLELCSFKTIELTPDTQLCLQDKILIPPDLPLLGSTAVLNTQASKKLERDAGVARLLYPFPNTFVYFSPDNLQQQKDQAELWGIQLAYNMPSLFNVLLGDACPSLDELKIKEVARLGIAYHASFWIHELGNMLDSWATRQADGHKVLSDWKQVVQQFMPNSLEKLEQLEALIELLPDPDTKKMIIEILDELDKEFSEDCLEKELPLAPSYPPDGYEWIGIADDGGLKEDDYNTEKKYEADQAKPYLLKDLLKAKGYFLRGPVRRLYGANSSAAEMLIEFPPNVLIVDWTFSKDGRSHASGKWGQELISLAQENAQVKLIIMISHSRVRETLQCTSCKNWFMESSDSRKIGHRHGDVCPQCSLAKLKHPAKVVNCSGPAYGQDAERIHRIIWQDFLQQKKHSV